MIRFLLLLLLVFPYRLFAQSPLITLEEASRVRQQLAATWKSQKQTQFQSMLNQPQLVIGGRTMKLWWRVYGNRPADGRSLYISLHGGGNVAHATNEQQWNNQKELYTPREGVYVAPLCVVDDWDMWFRPFMDDFYRQLIQAAVALFDVNPDKVYIMGYSAGGDGVWRLAPRMADSWAAASMMAGHPGDVRLENLRNTPFMIWCGALDAAYQRNVICRQRIAQMDSLHRKDPSGYTFQGHIVPGKPHWMDRCDTAAVSWMAQFRRQPYPKKIVWRVSPDQRPFFYWLAVPPKELVAGREVRLSCHDNLIDIERCDFSELNIYLNDQLVDLDRPIQARYRGKIFFNQKLGRSADILRETLSQRDDLSYMFDARLHVTF